MGIIQLHRGSYITPYKVTKKNRGVRDASFASVIIIWWNSSAAVVKRSLICDDFKILMQVIVWGGGSSQKKTLDNNLVSFMWLSTILNKVSILTGTLPSSLVNSRAADALLFINHVTALQRVRVKSIRKVNNNHKIWLKFFYFPPLAYFFKSCFNYGCS